MQLSEHIVRKVNAILGVSGEPHFADIPHEQLATGCVVWVLHPLSETTAPEHIATDIQLMLANGIDDKLAQVRSALVGENVSAYKSTEYWLDVYQTASRKIVVCPSQDQFDILRFEQGPSPYSDSEYFITELQKYDSEYGIDITGAGYNTVEFSLKRIPTGEAARELSARILQFDHDAIHGGGQTIEVIDFDHSQGRVALWWD
jgi:hypothetical protein